MIRVRRAKVHRSVGLTEAGKFAWYFFKADHIIYPANFPGLGEALIFFCFFSSIKGRPLPRQGSFSWYFFKADHIIYPANFPGLGEALIFFCCFSSIKGRKAGRETPRNSRLQAYRIRATSPFCTGRHTFPSERHRKKAPHQPYTTDKKPLSLPSTLYSLLSTLYPLPSTLYPLLSTLYPLPSTNPYSRTTVEAAPRPTPRSNTPSVRRGRYG